MQENNADSLVGTVVDHRYTIRSRIARGGMSTVYLATDLRLDRDVALKVLHPHLAHDRSFLNRLGSEAKAAARLSHPHVVGMLDQGDDGTTAYLVMEYIDGHTLRDVLIEKGALTTRLALALITPVVEGLAAAHAAGLIHRDVKPENVLLARDGRIKIGDFGLSRAVTTSTSTGVLLGTVAYISPELVMGRQADARSDIYALGIMLYEMLTGRQPFLGDVPIQVAYQHVNGAVPPSSRLVPGLAKDVDELVQWCTANDPENRPVNGTALLGELGHIRTRLTDAELDARPPAAKDSGLAPSSAAGHRPPPPPSRAPGTGVPADAGLPAGATDRAHQHTEIIPAANNPTAIFSAESLQAGATSYLPRHYPTAPIDSPRQDPTRPAGTRTPAYLDPDDRWAGPAPELPPGGQQVRGLQGKRAHKKALREEERARSKALSTPVRTLREGNPRRRGFLWVVVLILVTALATGAGWYFGMGPGSPGIIPQLVNKTEDAAKLELAEAGFSYSTTHAFDDSVAAGIVISTEPPGGVEIRRFERISLFISKGPQLFPLADLADRRLEEAKNILNSTGMALGPISEVYDDTVPAGTVLGQDPAPATDVRRGTPIALTVSKGPEPIAVPDVTGLERRAAKEALAAAGLTAEEVSEVNHRSVPAGNVVAQSPAGGTLPRGSTVELTVSKGPRMVRVPNYVGRQADVARKELQDLGFTVEIREILGGLFGTVRAQEPGGQELPEGSLVTLTVV